MKFLAKRRIGGRFWAKLAAMDLLVEVAVGLIVRGRQLLICRRPASAVLGGFWELPGGKIEPGETPTDALRRELTEELSVEVSVGRRIAVIEHSYADRRVRLNAFVCTVIAGIPSPLASDEIRWIDAAALDEYEFPPANRVLLAEITAHFNGGDDAAKM